MAKVYLTQAIVQKTACTSKQKKIDLFDTKCKGLLLEIRISGGKTWYVRYNNKWGTTRQYKLANAKDLTLAQARKMAAKHLNQIALGNDPAEEKLRYRQAPTIEAFIRQKYLPFIKTYKKSWSTDLSLLENHIIPRWANRHLNEVGREELLAFLGEYSRTHAPASRNRILILLRYMFNLAIKWDGFGLEKNPVYGIPLLEENNQRERYLTSTELSQLIEAIHNSENEMLRHIVPMLVMTGARKRELLNARWEHFDMDNNTWIIPVSKTGRRRHIPITQEMGRLLESITETRSCPYPFGNPKTGKPFVSIYYSWNTARRTAGLEDLRMHDLRHSFASFLVNAGRSLYEVQKLLGHTQIKTTQRYAHLSDDSLRSAANEASKVIQLGYRLKH